MRSAGDSVLVMPLFALAWASFHPMRNPAPAVPNQELPQGKHRSLHRAVMRFAYATGSKHGENRCWGGLASRRNPPQSVGNEADSFGPGLKRPAALVGPVGYALPPYIRVAR